jgi:hypothetical protein
MMWVLIILSLNGDPKQEGPYERTKCEQLMRIMNTHFPQGVWAHCLPEPK